MLEQELDDAHLIELLRFEVEALAQLPPEPVPPQRTPAPTEGQDTAPILASRQRHAALTLANTVRGERAALKRDIGDGAVTVRDLLQGPSAPADGCTVAELLRSQTGWGPRRTQTFLTRHAVGEHKQLGQLTARQRSVMAADLA